MASEALTQMPDPEDPLHPPRPLAPSTRPSEPARVRNVRVSGFSFPAAQEYLWALPHP